MVLLSVRSFHKLLWVFLLQLNSVLNCIQMWLIICEGKNVKSNRSEDEIVKLKSFPGYTRHCTSEGRKTQKKTSFRNGRFFCNFVFVCLFCLFCLFENIFVSIWLHSVWQRRKKICLFFAFTLMDLTLDNQIRLLDIISVSLMIFRNSGQNSIKFITSCKSKPFV